uniref:Uncharacterized protein n=1 Tax=Desertifilum tharense IPPAS B-1220 TaxID=1781255 RepID=A0ACD5GZ31_9CYAN
MVGLNWRQVYFAIASLVGLLILGVGWTIATRYTPMMVRTAASGTHALANLRFALQTPAVLISGTVFAGDGGDRIISGKLVLYSATS